MFFGKGNETKLSFMATTKNKPTNVDDYIALFPVAVQKKLKSVRKTIKAVAPKAEEVISYGIAGYKYFGTLIFFAGFKDHVSLYPAPRTQKLFKKELSVFKGGSGTIQFPNDKPIPLDLVKRIVKFRMKENEEKYNLKAAAKKALK